MLHPLDAIPGMSRIKILERLANLGLSVPAPGTGGHFLALCERHHEGAPGQIVFRGTDVHRNEQLAWCFILGYQGFLTSKVVDQCAVLSTHDVTWLKQYWAHPQHNRRTRLRERRMLLAKLPNQEKRANAAVIRAILETRLKSNPSDLRAALRLRNEAKLLGLQPSLGTYNQYIRALDVALGL